MNIETLREYCLQKKEVTEDFPFDENVLAFRVAKKIFALTDINSKPLEVNLKCNPEKAIELREEFSSITPGFHMNKKMWNTVICDGSLSDKLIFELVNHSYDEVIKGLPKKEQKRFLIHGS